MNIWRKVKSKAGDSFYHPVDDSDSSRIKVYKADISAEELEALVNDEHGSYITGHTTPNHILINTFSPQKDNSLVELPIASYLFRETNQYGPTLAPLNLHRTDAHFKTVDSSSILNDMKLFIDSRKIYLDLNVLHRRGYLLYGPPGNGKTALIREITKDPLFKNSHIIWCQHVPDTRMLRALKQTGTLKILIFEELLDENGRHNYSPSTLLQILDGEGTIDNCIIIATTNYPELLAKNLGDRPSRFDMVVELPNPDAKTCKHLLESFLKAPVTEEIDFFGFSIAHIKELVLVHKVNNISLVEASNRIRKQSQKFRDSFQVKKVFGFAQED